MILTATTLTFCPSDDLLSAIRRHKEDDERKSREMARLREELQEAEDLGRRTELQLLQELDMLHDKNSVLSNLLDIIQERADTAEQELERYLQVRERGGGGERERGMGELERYLGRERGGGGAGEILTGERERGGRERGGGGAGEILTGERERGEEREGVGELERYLQVRERERGRRERGVGELERYSQVRERGWGSWRDTYR